MIDTNVLKPCLTFNEEDHKLFEEYFEKELEDAIEFVKNDMEDNLQDSVDRKTKAIIAKRRKLCQNGHINTNVRANRTVCDRDYCKAKLHMERCLDANIVEKVSKVKQQDKITEKAIMYLNVPNILPNEIPVEKAVGAIAVNPNAPEWISKVLDEIIEAAATKNKKCCEISTK